MTQSPEEIRAKLRELGYLKNPLDRFVFGAGSARGALALALGAGGRGAILAGPLIGLFSIVLLGNELTPDERLSWFLALSLLAALIVFGWVVAQALALHALARLRGRALEALPAVAVIVSGITFLLPAIVWLLASRRIQSQALQSRDAAAMALAVLLMLAASVSVFAATRAADVLALNRIEAMGGRRRGWRSAAAGCALFALVAGTLLRKPAGPRGAAGSPPAVDRSGPRSKGAGIRVVAIDGVRDGTLAAALGADAKKLTSFESHPDLLATWLKIQTGRVNGQPQHFLGYRAFWGGRAHSDSEAPGRLLRMLRALGLSRIAPLPGRIYRPRFFWEVPVRDLTLVVGGWGTYPVNRQVTNVISDRAFFTLLGGGSSAGLVKTLHPDFPPIESVYRRLQAAPAGLQLDEFHRELFSENYYFVGGDVCFAHWGPSWVYLPGADIVCDKSPAQCGVAIRKNAEFIAALDRSSAILLIENPGRRGGTGAIWFRPAGNETIRTIHAPEEVAAAVLDYLGYPLAADLAGVKPAEAKLASYGTITLEDPGDASDDATLKALRQLGYIQ